MPDTYAQRPKKTVEAAEITAGNIEDLAIWCGGIAFADEGYLRVPTVMAPEIVPIGDYLVREYATGRFHGQDKRQFEEHFDKIGTGDHGYSEFKYDNEPMIDAGLADAISRGNAIHEQHRKRIADETPGYVPGLSHAMHDVDAFEHEARTISSTDRNLLFGKPSLNKE